MFNIAIESGPFSKNLEDFDSIRSVLLYSQSCCPPSTLLRAMKPCWWPDKPACQCIARARTELLTGSR
ncbi:unnamed protein product [Boreogadus saida]